MVRDALGRWRGVENDTAGEFGIVHLEIIQYANTSFRKLVVTTTAMHDADAFTMLFHNALHWSNTAAITSLRIDLENGEFVSGSVLRLYGES